MLDHLELSALGYGALMDVAAENELDSCRRKSLQHQVALAHRTLVCSAPRRCGKMVVKRDRPQRTGLHGFELRREAVELGRIERAPLLTPRTN